MIGAKGDWNCCAFQNQSRIAQISAQARQRLEFYLTKVKIKVGSSDVIKPFAARFANSKNILWPPALCALIAGRRARPKARLIWIVEDEDKKKQERERGREFRRQARNKSKFEQPLQPMGVCARWAQIRRKITRAYLNLNQTHAINAHCAVTVKNEAEWLGGHV